MLMISFIITTRFNGLYGQDSYEYLRFTNALMQFVKHGTDPGKDYWPVLYPICGIIFSLVFKPLFALQFISVISLILSGIYLEKLLKLLYNEETNIIRLFVFSFFLLSPYLLRVSLTVMADSLCLLFITAAYYCVLKYKEEKHNKYFICFVVLATAAIATRYAAFIVLFIPAVYTTYYFLQKFNLKSLLVAVLTAILILMPYVLIHKNSSADFLNIWVQGWSYKNFFHSDFHTEDGHQTYTFPNIFFCFFNLVHPAYCFAGILLMAASIKSFLKNSISGVPWIFMVSPVVYAFFLAGFPFQDLRHLILSFPFVLILFFPGHTALYSFLKKIKPGIINPFLLLCIAIQLTFFVRVFIPFYHYNKIEKQISNEVIKHDSATLYTFSIDAAIRHYGFKGRIINLWEVKLDTMRPVYELALVLFNEKQFSEVWKNKNPMLNWEYLKANYHLTKLSDLPDDWELYSIKTLP